MESCRLRSSGIGQLFAECATDTRCWQNGSHSVPRADILCPEPRWATRAPVAVDNLSRFSSKSRCLEPLQKAELGLGILDIILSKNEPEDAFDIDGESPFFSGSPPERTTNPIIRDPNFVNQSSSTASPIKPSSRVHRGSPSCAPAFSTNPIRRIEGFSCNESDNHRIVSARA
ncbi:hypothetical protein ACMD2_21427 [Ananas comosus]|uniref:Uncharacterized protein n=1 Tax=Ananas comosus TaxID=4615 RepID=A0A199V971_ANACO|nr:hypothetical protein ACMD2_21427 [Ananas comosus]